MNEGVSEDTVYEAIICIALLNFYGMTRPGKLRASLSKNLPIPGDRPDVTDYVIKSSRTSSSLFRRSLA